MATAAVTANSLEGQVDQLLNQFKGVTKSASAFVVHQGRSTDMLHTAMEQVYEFGEDLFSRPNPPGASFVGEFFKASSVPYNARTRSNAYIGLVKLAFVNALDSSRSQYATVLHYASTLKTKPTDFKQWLIDNKGIEGVRKLAMEADAKRSLQKNSQGKQTRLQQAEADLLARPSSNPVTLPAGVTIPEGFAIVLAKVDSLNNASIIDLVQADPQKVSPVLLQLSAQQVTRPSTALESLRRAVRLILETTPDKPDNAKAARDIAIRNASAQGNAAATIQAVSEAHIFPGAIVTHEGYVGLLPDGDTFILTAGDAQRFLDDHDRHGNWTLDASGLLSADGLVNPIQLTQMAQGHAYRVADAIPNPDKHLKATPDDLRSIVNYIEQERAAFTKNKGKAKATFPRMAGLSIAGTRLQVGLSSSLRHATLAETGAEEMTDDRTVSVTELEALAKALAALDVEVDGWIMDGDVDDAALVLTAFVDDDELRVVLPTRTGSSYNQVCKDLA